MVDGGRRPNGLEITRVRVPLGRVLVVYEARPNVTVDVACLCVKSGNVASCAARRPPGARTRRSRRGTRRAARRRAAGGRGARARRSRDELARFVGIAESADVVVPRGGEALKHFLLEHARVPVLAAAGGVCHVYVDATADPAMATSIAVNAKTHRPGVCNAMETLLVHADRTALLPDLLGALADRGVELRGCERTRAAAPALTSRRPTTTTGPPSTST